MVRQLRTHTTKELEDWLVQLKGVPGTWARDKRLAIRKYLNKQKEVTK